MSVAAVLGANGQDGSYLTEALLARGYDVVGVGRQPASRYMAPGGRFCYRPLDLEDAAGLAALLDEARPDAVFHVAAVHGSAGFRYEPVWRSMMAVNVLALHAVLEHARTRAPALRVVYANSSKVFPAPLAGPVDESTATRATCLYSIGKIAARDLIRQYREVHGVAASNLFLFNHESPRRPASFFLPTVARAIVQAQSDPGYRTTVKTLDFRVDWMSAQEAMSIAVDIAERAPDQDFVLGSGVTWHGRAAVQEIFRRHGLDASRHLMETLPSGDAGPDFHVNLARLESCVGRRPRRDLFAIMDELVAAARAGAVA